MSTAKTMPLIPKVSEKSFMLSEDNTYVLMVPITATKGTVREAVEEQFNVTVKSVRISVNKGKKKSSSQRRRQPIDGFRKDTKRAYVTIKEGDNIPVFEESK